jgi:hypothetical protein
MVSHIIPLQCILILLSLIVRCNADGLEDLLLGYCKKIIVKIDYI